MDDFCYVKYFIKFAKLNSFFFLISFNILRGKGLKQFANSKYFTEPSNIFTKEDYIILRVIFQFSGSLRWLAAKMLLWDLNDFFGNK